MPKQNDNPALFIGLMSGTSMDGVDGALASFPTTADGANPVNTLATAYIPFPAALRADLADLQAAGSNEIHREAIAANTLVQHYAECVAQLLARAGVAANAVRAIGAHGQTIRHRPELGYTRQINNPALLAELSGIDVVADFRSRDIAAGGQGAPLVPAFHQMLFGHANATRAVVNIGGIGNVSVLRTGSDRGVIGFDTGPGNVLMDAWINTQRGNDYDVDGAWAAGGAVVPLLLQVLHEEPYLALPPPKSTGRDLFNHAWLLSKLAGLPGLRPEDVQATLAAYTAGTLADALAEHAADAKAIYVCGGGAYNRHLMEMLAHALRAHGHGATLQSTDALGVSPNHVEALAFAWLAHRFTQRKPGNVPEVTGAQGLRILGALYPAG